MAIIFDIQRSSFVDGTGARTTVFLKGCNLNCRWCHNPEGISPKIEIAVNKDLCSDCKKCLHVCKNGQKSCDFCGECVIYCARNARQIYGKEYSANQVLDILLRDKDYFDITGGGLTLSGGECMLQIDFAEELLRLCKQNGIGTAIDTAGCVPYEYFERILPYTDDFLYDVKCISRELHKIGTGKYSDLILSNLERLSQVCPEKITVRVPIVVGFNAESGELEKIAAHLKKLGIKRIELLPYHNMSEHKYNALGREFTAYGTPSAEMMQEFKKIFEVCL